MRRTWSIGNKQTIDKTLNKFLFTAIELSVHKETEIRRKDRWEKERQIEQKRQHEISQKRWDEKKRVDALENEIALWHKSQQIRAYVSYVHNLVVKNHGKIEEGSNLDQWIRWATRRADIIDPLIKVETELWEIDLDRRSY